MYNVLRTVKVNKILSDTVHTFQYRPSAMITSSLTKACNSANATFGGYTVILPSSKLMYKMCQKGSRTSVTKGIRYFKTPNYRLLVLPFNVDQNLSKEIMWPFASVNEGSQFSLALRHFLAMKSITTLEQHNYLPDLISSSCMSSRESSPRNLNASFFSKI